MGCSPHRPNKGARGEYPSSIFKTITFIWRKISIHFPFLLSLNGTHISSLCIEEYSLAFQAHIPETKNRPHLAPYLSIHCTTWVFWFSNFTFHSGYSHWFSTLPDASWFSSAVIWLRLKHFIHFALALFRARGRHRPQLTWDAFTIHSAS